MNSQYKLDVSKYQKGDAIIAICFWFVLMVLYAAAGKVGNLLGVHLITVVSIILPITCIAIVLIKRQGFSSLGFRKENLWPSLCIGLLFGILAIISKILPAIIYGWELQPFGYLLYQLLFILVGVALVEEIIFRGYIQTRLYGIFKNDVSAILMGALFFALMHAPFQLASGNRAFDLSFVIWLTVTFVMHIIFNHIFRKFYSIYGPILFHTLNNWSYSLFGRDNWYIYIYLGIVVLALVIWNGRSLYLLRQKN